MVRERLPGIVAQLSQNDKSLAHFVVTIVCRQWIEFGCCYRVKPF
jgi:hypothetical protein